MKVLFAMRNPQASKNVVDKYYELYGEMIEYKDVFYYRALLEEVKKDKTYDRIVISEDLEEFKVVTIEEIDQAIFSNIDNITDEIEDTDIVFIGSDRRTKMDTLVSRLFNLGIYSLLLGNDRNISSLCDIIHDPRSKKDAKEYLNSNPAVSSLGATQNLREDEVDEGEFNNILKHYEKLGNDTSKYVSSFESIAEQYSKAQLKTIAGGISAYLPPIVSETIMQDPRYTDLFNSVYRRVKKNPETNQAHQKTDGKKTGLFNFLNNKKSDESKKIVADANKMQEQEEEKARLAAEQAEKEAKALREQAEKQAKLEAERLKKEAEERKAKEQEELRKKAEEEAQIRAEAERLAKEQEALRKKAEAERIAKEQRELLQKAEEERRAKEKAEREARAQETANPAKGIEIEIGTNTANTTSFGGVTVDVEPKFVDVGKDVNNSFDEQKKLKEEADTKAKAEAERIAKEQEELKQRAIAEAKAKAEAEAKAKAEAERIAKEQEELKQRAIAEAKAKAEAERKAKEQAEIIAKEQEILRQKAAMEEKAQRLAKEQEELKAKLANEQLAQQQSAVQSVSMLATSDSSDELESNFQSSIYELPSDYKKVIAVVGTNKVGTTFVVNAIANNVSEKGIKTSVLDMTKTRGLYYLYNKGDSKKIEISKDCLKNLSEGSNTPVFSNKYLNVYTSLPNLLENRKVYKHKTVIDTLKKSSNLVIVDCDFSTPIEYFEQAQDIYIVQDMDIIKLQETTAFLRELKARNIEWSKLKVIVNKYVKSSFTPKKIVEVGLVYYNDPQMTYTEEFEPITSYITIPLTLEDYTKYTEGLVKDRILYKEFTPEFRNSIEQICMKIYPQKNSSNNKRKGLFGN